MRPSPAALAEPGPPLEFRRCARPRLGRLRSRTAKRPVGAGRFARNEEDSTPSAPLPSSTALPWPCRRAGRRAAAWAAGRARRARRSACRRPTMSATAYGTEGEEMCLQLLALDRELGDFFTSLDGRGIDYSVVLTADHGGLDVPERQRAAGHPDAARVDPKLTAGDDRAALITARAAGLRPLRRRQLRRHVCRPLAVAPIERALEAARRSLPRPSAGRGGVHRRGARRYAVADRSARQVEPDRARPRQLFIPGAPAISSCC